MIRRTLATFALFGVVATAAHANIVTTTGDTTTGATYNRPLEDLSAISLTGTAVRYGTTQINVSTSGVYTVLTAGAYDTFTTLYSPSFNPLMSLNNARIANDDLAGTTGLRNSGLAFDLVANTNYFLVNTGFANTDFGAFVNTIGGAGVVTVNPALVAPAPATILTFTGDTTNGPRFNRPLEDLSALSLTGTNVAYDRFDFSVATSGLYTFTTTGGFDTFALLYTAFDPTAPLTGVLAVNDDALGLTTSAFSYSLVAGLQYSFINGGFSNTDTGFFSSTINGPGAILRAGPSAVPEPSSPALLLAGIALMGWAVRRRQRR